MKEISEKEVTDLLQKWFEIVENGGSAEERASMYLYPHSRFIMPDGTSMDFNFHYQMHTKWCEEKHECGTLYITPISSNPPRVKVEGTVYWEACYKNTNPKEIIKTVVGKSIIIEKLSDNTLKFVLHQNIFFHLIPGSAKIQFE